MRQRIKEIPLLGQFITKLYRIIYYRVNSFPGSEDYWQQRYIDGRNSGAGSYNKLAEYKAEFINSFVAQNNIATIIEFGCGDGNQLKYAAYPSYIGFDTSLKAIELCKEIFQDDRSKNFRLMSEYDGDTSQLTLSLDVIHHLVEDHIYYTYMERLFCSSERYVIIYSSNFDEKQRYHIRHRNFTKYVSEAFSEWKLKRYLPNKYPFVGKGVEGSHSDFYVYERFTE